jgi:hypothetical protein
MGIELKGWYLLRRAYRASDFRLPRQPVRHST